MKWINGPPTTESLDSGKSPGVTQELDGGSNGPWKYVSGPRLDVVIARHLRAYISRYLMSDIMVGIVTTYISNSSQALQICIFDLTQFRGEGPSRIAKDPVWLTILLFKCNVHNTNPITLNCKIVTPSDVIAPGASHLGSMIVGARIWKMADVCTSSNLYGVDLYKGTGETPHLNFESQVWYFALNSKYHIIGERHGLLGNVGSSSPPKSNITRVRCPLI